MGERARERERDSEGNRAARVRVFTSLETAAGSTAGDQTDPELPLPNAPPPQTYTHLISLALCLGHDFITLMLQNYHNYKCFWIRSVLETQFYQSFNCESDSLATYCSLKCT